MIRALCDRKSAGADYQRHARIPMEEIGVSSYKADPDAWLQVALKDNGVECHQCVILYVDDVLETIEEPGRFVCKEIGKRFTLKEKPIGLLSNMLVANHPKLR